MRVNLGAEDDLTRHGRKRPGRPGPVEGRALAWIILLAAGLLEVVWAFAMKQSDGFTRLLPSAVTIGAALASFGLLALAMRSLPLGTAYVVWTGIGAIGAFAAGVIWLGESLSPTRLVAAGLILAGLALMKASAA
jgi:quaternary ammonium compound-resistance protein SugE